MILLLSVSLLAACQSSEPGAGARPAALPPIPVHTQQVVSMPWIDEIEALGTAQANESVTLTAKVTESVERINFTDGEIVRGGDVLIELTGRAEVAQLTEAQAAFTESQKQLARLEELVKQGTVTRSQVDAQLAARDQARARREAIRARLADRVITAPFDGVLGFRQVSEGTLLTPGTTITTLDDIRTIKLDFSVPERFLESISIGAEVVARSAAFHEASFVGVVRSIASRVDPITRSVQVRAHIDNADFKLKPGMLMSVRLKSPERSALVVDEIALIQTGRQAYVFVLDAEGKASRVDVSVGGRKSGKVELLSGLSAGVRVVTDGVVKLRPGLAAKDLGDAGLAQPALAPAEIPKTDADKS
jgi:membrane fusion protein (multidrug efflux system)